MNKYQIGSAIVGGILILITLLYLLKHNYSRVRHPNDPKPKVFYLGGQEIENFKVDRSDVVLAGCVVAGSLMALALQYHYPNVLSFQDKGLSPGKAVGPEAIGFAIILYSIYLLVKKLRKILKR